jgi:RNA polymerase sigma-70 factor (ECF subfamily)
MDPFETIVTTHYQSVLRLAMSLTRIESDAQDLTQHTFYIWAAKGHTLRDSSKVKSWLFTTLHRKFLSARRNQIRFPHYNLEDVSEQMALLAPESFSQLDSPQVLSALARIDSIYRPAVALFYLEEYSYRDISIILETPIGTVKSRIARGVGQLRGFLLSSGCREPAPSRKETRTVTISAQSVAKHAENFISGSLDWAT